MHKKILIGLIAASMALGGTVAANAAPANPITVTGTVTLSLSSDGLTVSRSGNYTYADSSGANPNADSFYGYAGGLVVCDSAVLASTTLESTTRSGCNAISIAQGVTLALSNSGSGSGLTISTSATTTSDTLANPSAHVDFINSGFTGTSVNLTGKFLALQTQVQTWGPNSYYHYSASVAWSDGTVVAPPVVVVTPVVTAPVFNQPKFAMPSKIEVDGTGKVKLSGKDMGVSSVAVGGKAQKIDLNTDEKLEFDTTGLTAGVHDLVMKGGFGTYTVQKAIQVGEVVVTKVAAVSARQVAMAGGELSISGQGLEGTSQISMNGQILEIISKTDSKVTFKVPASTVASINDIMIEGSFVPVIFKKAFSYNR